MKIVINKCFGGFGLSKDAIIELHRLKDPHIEEITPKEYFGDEEYSKSEEYRKQHYDTCGLPLVDGKILLDNHRCDYNAKKGEEYSPRACKLLVFVVNKLKEKANGKCAKLEIVKIPKDIKFEIDEYNGVETIHEKHRSWG